MNNILDFNLEDLEQWMVEKGQNKFRAKQVFDWIYKGIFKFEEMKNLPNNLKEVLNAEFAVIIPEIVEHYKSNNDNTNKLLLKYPDSNVIEAVIMEYKHGYSICISSQIGCRMGCKFCASTLNGMVRNMTSGEILSQLIVAQKFLNIRISNIVIMGTGEPLDNYDNILKFLKSVNAEYGLNIGQRHITISTCGLVPKIFDLAREKLQVTLAISLHAPNDEIRKQIMPIANKYSIIDIIEACQYYIDSTGRRITFEYALIRDVNDSKENAKELASKLKNILCHVNLIPMNEVKESIFKKSTKDSVTEFKNILEQKGIQTTIRRELGADINAACGQLRKSYLDKNLDFEKGCEDV